MKIGHLDKSANSVVNEVRNGNKSPVRDNFSATSPTAGRADVEISDGARLMKTAFDNAKLAPDVREDRVAFLRSKIKDGSYHVDAERLAERILADHLASDFGKNNL